VDEVGNVLRTGEGISETRTFQPLKAMGTTTSLTANKFEVVNRG
jgi:hypothetical protein